MVAPYSTQPFSVSCQPNTAILAAFPLSFMSSHSPLCQCFTRAPSCLLKWCILTRGRWTRYRSQLSHLCCCQVSNTRLLAPSHINFKWGYRSTSHSLKRTHTLENSTSFFHIPCECSNSEFCIWLTFSPLCVNLRVLRWIHSFIQCLRLLCIIWSLQ